MKRARKRLMEEILSDCLVRIFPHCKRREHMLLPFMNADDMAEEVGVRVWLAMMRYTNLPPDQLKRVAFTVAFNELTTLVRPNRGPRAEKRGGKSLTLRIGSSENSVRDNGRSHINAAGVLDANYLKEERVLTSDPETVYFFMQVVVHVAIRLVGPENYPLLAKAAVVNWENGTKLTKDHKLILHKLNLSIKEIRKLISKFVDDVISVIKRSNTKNNLLMKSDGVWHQF